MTISHSTSARSTSRLTGPQPPFRAVVGPVIIAHRGGSLEAPENTVASILHGVRVGSDWQEIDVTLSKDDAVVVFHDDSLERTTGTSGMVESTPLAELKRLCVGRPTWSKTSRTLLESMQVPLPKFGDRFAQEKIPTLDQILAIPDARVMIELKKSTRTERLAEKVIDAIHRGRAEDRIGIASLDPLLLDAVYSREPSFPLIGVAEDVATMDAMLLRPINVLAVRADLVTEAFEKAPAGIAIWVWTVYRVDHAQALAEQGVHGIITDIPQAVVHALRGVDPSALAPP